MKKKGKPADYMDEKTAVAMISWSRADEMLAAARVYHVYAKRKTQPFYIG